MNFQVYRDYGGATQALWLTFYVLGALTMMVVALCFLVRTSKFGLGLLAIREDEDAARALGKNAFWYKLQSLMIGGAIGGCACSAVAKSSALAVVAKRMTVEAFMDRVSHALLGLSVESIIRA